MNISNSGNPQPEAIQRAVASYKNSGFGLINNMFSAAEINQLVLESEYLWTKYINVSLGNLRLGIRSHASGKTIFDRLDPVADISKTFNALNWDSRLVSIAESCLGGPVTIMKEKLIFKRPGTQGFGPHRDQDYTSAKSGVPGSEVITISIALDKAPRSTGPVEFFPSLRNLPTKAPADEPRDVDVQELLSIESCMPENEPGDIILFDGQIPHRSDWNRSDHSRRIYMISYVPDRYSNARRNYYAARLSEQAEQRQNLVTEELYFE